VADTEPSLIVLDTETTGLTAPIGVVELAWARINMEMEVIDEFDTLVNPERDIEPGAFRVHGISQEDVAGAPTLKQVIAPLAGRPVVVIGHNISFDLRIVGGHLDVVADVCTLALSRQYLRGTPERPLLNHKLTTVREFLGLPCLDAHRALGDTHTSLNVLRRILHDHGLSLDKIIKRQAKPRLLHTMPFGKHAGMVLSQVPLEYRRWLLGAGNLDKDLAYSLRKLDPQ
jgi:exodeoxyribonuclease X